MPFPNTIQEVMNPKDNNKRIGTKFEARVEKDLIKKGYVVTKSHNIHYDRHATKAGKTYIVECKENQGQFSQDEVNEAIQAVKRGDIYLLARCNNNRRIKYFHPGSNKYKQERGTKRPNNSGNEGTIPAF